MTPNAALKPASPLHSPEALERQTALAPDFPQAVLGTDGAPLGFNRAPVRIAPDETGLAALDRAIDEARAGRVSSVVLLLPDAEADEADKAAPNDEALFSALPKACRERLSTFTHPNRRRQSFSARLSALLLAARFMSAEREREAAYVYAEEPPYGPILMRRTASESTAAPALWLTLAHAAGGTAASLSFAPMGIDLERPRPVKRLMSVADFAFGADAAAILARAAERLPPEAFTEVFFALWGAKESEIKMNRTPQALVTHPRAKSSFEALPDGRRAALVVRAPEGRRLSAYFYRSGTLLLSVLAPAEKSPPAEPAVFALTGTPAERSALFLRMLEEFREDQGT
ncbi:hypothetical protein H6A60_10490 [Sutterella massiliensis]|uniref:4'-phosphopantetheinyl transferase domain-containing protein n=1 Tax=Sutterella massiliensis TaxID=1816689 RepID=A0ABS2DUC8_9BURK|nr:hypothetical protein [Sutterella massiliensis]MBM6704902.1 hypothetical protein [Sutterella massiliensis]